jgi:hypothetical protein
MAEVDDMQAVFHVMLSPLVAGMDAPAAGAVMNPLVVVQVEGSPARRWCTLLCAMRKWFALCKCDIVVVVSCQRCRWMESVLRRTMTMVTMVVKT